MNGKIVIMANSIAEAEKDLEMIKALSKSGIMCGCGGSLPCDCEDDDCDCGCEDCGGYDEGYEDGYDEGWADAKAAMLDALND